MATPGKEMSAAELSVAGRPMRSARRSATKPREGYHMVQDDDEFEKLIQESDDERRGGDSSDDGEAFQRPKLRIEVIVARRPIQGMTAAAAPEYRYEYLVKYVGKRYVCRMLTIATFAEFCSNRPAREAYTRSLPFACPLYCA